MNRKLKRTAFFKNATIINLMCIWLKKVKGSVLLLSTLPSDSWIVQKYCIGHTEFLTIKYMDGDAKYINTISIIGI